VIEAGDSRLVLGSSDSTLGRRRLLSGIALLALGACGGRSGTQHVNLPAPSERNAVGPGDVFSMEIVGEKELPKDYQVAADGSVDVPYVHSIQVAGLEAPEVAEVIRERLKQLKILTDPSVIVQVKEYRSRRITIIGQVSKPGSFPFTSGMTLIQAISVAGGLTALADTDRVNLTRKSDNGRTYTALVAVGAMMEGKAPDVPLQSGDQIFVHERIF
jgi:protein involved in polysaccharide export with SLBB domain